MRSGQWRWASAKATGTSHRRRHAPCDDFGAAFEIKSGAETVFVQAVSDGAGSAPNARFGARLVCSALARAVRLTLAEKTLAGVTDEDIHCWVDTLRDRIATEAKHRNATQRSFAATLVCAVIGRETTVVAHIGDGAFVYRKRAGFWRVAHWPAQGEYAGTTDFVTDDASPRIGIVRISGRVLETAVFSDGLERLALAFDEKKPFTPFFEKMLGPLRTSNGAGRNRQLSSHLQRFLDSPSVNDRTDDDKTLILARRVPRR